MVTRSFGLSLLLVALLASAVCASTIWDVEYSTRGSVAQQTKFYGEGAYEFLLTPDYITVYRHQPGTLYHGDGTTTIAVISVFQGMYLEPYGGYPAAVLPEGFPAIVFPPGTDDASAVPRAAPLGSALTSSVPEPGSGALLALGALLLAGSLAARRFA